MISNGVSSASFVLVAASLLCAVSCAAPETGPEPGTTGSEWNFAVDTQGWTLVLYDANSENTHAVLSWSSTEGSPDAGALQIVVPFEKASQYVSVVAPIVPDPLSAGIDLGGRKFSVRVRSSASFTGGALIFTNSGPSPSFPGGQSAMVPLTTTGWMPIELDLAQVNAPYDIADVRFLGVIIATGTVLDPPVADYTFYVDTAVIGEIP
jgi:hypothetical protein